MLNQPLPGTEPSRTSDAQAEAEGDSFMAAMAMHAANTAR